MSGAVSISAPTASLSVSDITTVNVVLEPVAAAVRSFGTLLIVGASPVINTNQRLRMYTTLTGVGEDFGTTAPEYLASQAFFSQSPQPSIVYIGRWAKTDTNGELDGAVLQPLAAALLLTALQAIHDGSLEISVDGTPYALTGMDFTPILTLNGAAAVVQTLLTPHATVVWNAGYGQFIITSTGSGAGSSVGYATPAGSGTDVSGLLGLSLAAGSASPVVGAPSETPLACVQTLAANSNNWYGLMFADTSLTVQQHLQVAGYIEGASPARIYAVTTQDPNTLVATSITDLAAELMAGSFSRSFIQYSSYNPYAVASAVGKAFTVDFTGSNTTLTLKFKTEPGINAEYLTETQAAVLNGKNCNVFVHYNNATAILQQGQMSSGIFFDERHGADWLQNWVQTAVYNLLYETPTKIPQTDAGVHLIATTVADALQQAVTNGFAAGGVWNGPSFGQILQGQTLPAGFYVYAPPVASQSYTVRQTRQAPLIQCAVTEAGAVHFANVLITVSR